jgi:hypothetical protein
MLAGRWLKPRSGQLRDHVTPPLVCGQAESDEVEQIPRHTMTEAQELN